MKPYQINENNLRLGGKALTDCSLVIRGTNETCGGYIAERIREKTGVRLRLVTDGTPAEGPVFLTAERWNENPAGEICAIGEGWYRVSGEGTDTRIELMGDSYLTLADTVAAFLLNFANGQDVSAGTVRKVSDASQFEAESPLTGKQIPVDRILLCGIDIGAYSVVYAADAAEKVVLAANELSSYIEKATGKKLPVIPDTEHAKHEICVGITNRDTENVRSRRAKLQNDGIVYYIENERLYITSHTDAGQLYAVYHFLEDHVGCLFLYTGCEVIRENGVIEIPRNLDYSHSSPFFWRLTDWGGYDLSMKRKTAINADEDIRYRITGGWHSLGRLAETGISLGLNPCLTDENVYQTVLKNVRRLIRDNPGCRVISVTQTDSQTERDRCHCENCRRAAEALGNETDLLLTFINRLADDIREDYPDVLILTFAYQWTRRAPVHTRARENVAMLFCTLEGAFNVPLDDPGPEENRDIMRDMNEWRAFGDKFYFWDYTTNYRLYARTFSDLFVIWKNVKIFADRGGIGLFEEGNPAPENGEFHHLRAWLLTKLLWDPYMSWETYSGLMDEFLRYYYGAGWKYIRCFIDLTNAAQFGKMTIFDKQCSGHYADKYQLLDCFDRAIRASTDDVTRDRCRMSSLQLCIYDMTCDEEETPDDAVRLLRQIPGMKSPGIFCGQWRDVPDVPWQEAGYESEEDRQWAEAFHAVYDLKD